MTMMRGLGRVETRPERCERHGDYDAILMTIGSPRWTGCPVCAREAMQREDHAAMAGQEDARRRDQGEALARAAGIPMRHAGSNFDAFEAMSGTPQEDTFMRVWNYATGDGLLNGEGLLLCGTPGAGKTHLACALIGHLTRQRLLSARYVTAADVFRRVRAMYTTRQETERDIIEDLAAPTLLVIDEVGLSSGSDHEASLFAQILSRRYDDMTATVLVTNLTPSQLHGWLDSRTWDRLRDTSRAITFTWDSRRGRT